ncbi:hypothetical protein RUM43_005994 [Polyplax serrata]|uniref:Uncharacterized protein n=1 Tax=Polyplax serrata TaxID=468196 RepID=A0AAN8PKE8_POLSC
MRITKGSDIQSRKPAKSSADWKENFEAKKGKKNRKIGKETRESEFDLKSRFQMIPFEQTGVLYTVRDNRKYIKPSLEAEEEQPRVLNLFTRRLDPL